MVTVHIDWKALLIDSPWEMKAGFALIIFHLYVLAKAAWRREWGWFWALGVFPLLDIYYFFRR